MLWEITSFLPYFWPPIHPFFNIRECVLGDMGSLHWQWSWFSVFYTLFNINDSNTIFFNSYNSRYFYKHNYYKGFLSENIVNFLSIKFLFFVLRQFSHKLLIFNHELFIFKLSRQAKVKGNINMLSSRSSHLILYTLTFKKISSMDHKCRGAGINLKF